MKYENEFTLDTNSVPEVMWKSKETTPNGDPFMTVKKADGYYYYAERGGRDSIAFILKDSVTNKYAMIRESKPPMYERNITSMVTAFGGSIDMNKTPIEIAQIEIQEESGFKIDIQDITDVGSVLVSTQMNQKCFLFIADVTNYEEYNGIESGTEVVWLSKEDIIKTYDWKAITILAKSGEI
jgi:hypothetical protein